MPSRHVICRASELPPGERKIVQIGKKSVGIFNVGGEFYALLNLCPHQFAPLCQGRVTGTTVAGEVGEFPWTKDGEIVRCPWHGWEFDIKTGRSVFNPHRVRTQTFEVAVESEATCEHGGEDAAVETFPVEVQGAQVVLILP